MRVDLRDYQSESVERLVAALAANEHPLCVLPTGSGKSLVLAGVLQRLNADALVLTHVAELLEQNSKALRRIAPDMEQSFYVAKLREKNPNARVVFGSVQSVVRALPLFRKPRRYLFIDEAHLCPRKGSAMYAQVFAHFMGAQRIGLTATPKRLDGSGSLVDGDDAWFSTIAHDIDVRLLIKRGFLLPLTGVIAELQADLAGVGSRGGEYIAEQAAAAVQASLPLPAAVAKACRYARKRKSWLVFAASIEHAHEIATELSVQGISNAVVTSKTDDDARAEAIAQFRSGEVRALVNVGVLTTGFDAPATDCIISMRPTQSDVLWQQILGRGMRLSEEKKNCLLLDFVGNLERLGGVGAVSETYDMRTPEAVTAARIATEANRRKVKPRDRPELFDPSSEDPMRNGSVFEAEVQHIDGFVVPSRRFPGTHLLILTYELEDGQGRAFKAKEFLCVEYKGGALHLARRWFARRGLTGSQVPTNAHQALALVRVLEEPTEVMVRYDPKLGCYKVDAERFATHTATAQELAGA